MSISTHVIAQREEDEEFKAHMKIVVACHDAGVSLPKETEEYLKDAADYSDVRSIRIHALEMDIEQLVSEQSGEGCTDKIVVLSELPKSVKKLIFRISW